MNAFRLKSKTKYNISFTPPAHNCVDWWCNGYGIGLAIKRSQPRRYDSQPFHRQVTTLRKLFTHMCLCHQAV